MKQRKRKSNDKQLVVLSEDDGDDGKVSEKELKRKPRVRKENKIEGKNAAAIKKRRKGKEKADVICVEDDESDNQDDQLQQDDDYQPKSEDEEEPEEEEEEILAEHDALSNNITCHSPFNCKPSFRNPQLKT